MQKIVYSCNHCGKEFDAKKGFADLELDDLDRYVTVDLCPDCFDELCKIVNDFINNFKTNNQNSL